MQKQGIEGMRKFEKLGFMLRGLPSWSRLSSDACCTGSTTGSFVFLMGVLRLLDERICFIGKVDFYMKCNAQVLT